MSRDARMPRPVRWLALPAAAIAAGALAVPATAEVRPGKDVSILHNSDLVAVFGYQKDSPVTVQLRRGGVIVAQAKGAAREGPVPGSFGLEVNHGALAPEPGDCWDGYTPDVRPGDEVVVLGDGGSDSVLVDDILVNPPTAVSTDVIFTGHARRAADGTPIDVATLGVETRRVSPRVRAEQSAIAATDAAGGWQATFSRPYQILQQDPGLNDDQLQDAIVNADEASVGYIAEGTTTAGAVSQFAGLDAGGPAPEGCVDVAPARDNAIAYVSRESVNAATQNAPIMLSGVLGAGVTGVSLTINGETGPAADVNLVTGTWTAELSGAAVSGLDEGTNTVTATFSGSTPQPTHSRTIAKDVTAPTASTAAPGTGTYTTPQSVTVSNASDPGAALHFTVDGSTPDAGSPTVSGPLTISESRTLKVVAIDTAGNVGPVAEFVYTFPPPPAPPAQQGAAQQPAQAPAPGVIAAAGPFGAPTGGSSPSVLALDSLVTSSQITSKRARSVGLRLVMRLQEGTEVVRVRIYRRLKGGKRKLLSSGFRSTGGRTGLYRLKQNHRSLRRSLKAGRYVIEVTPGTSRTELGRTSQYNVRIVNPTSRRR